MDGAFMRTAEDVQEQLYRVYPQTKDRFEILSFHEGGLRAKLSVHADDFRPGGTISGPTMFTLADCAFYALILAMQEEQVQAVTTNIAMNFFHRPKHDDLIAYARILKMGTRLVVGDVLLSSGGRDVAHASITYALFSSPSAGRLESSK